MDISTANQVLSPQDGLTIGALNGATGRLLQPSLEINVIALWGDGSETPIVLVGVDTLYVGAKFANAVRSAFPEIPHRNFVIGATHTHFAPMLDETKPRLGEANPQFQLDAIRAGIECTGRAIGGNRKKARLEVALSRASHSINRRLKKKISITSRGIALNSIANAPNVNGPTDEIITRIDCIDEQDRQIACLWNYACHPVGVEHDGIYSANFPGVVRDRIRSHLNRPDLPVIYLQGFSGDTKPSALTVVDSKMKRLQSLITGPVFQLMPRDRYEKWSNSLADLVLNADTEIALADGGVEAARRTMNSSEVFSNGGEDDLHVQAILVSEKLLFVGVSAEVVVDYAIGLRRLHPERVVVPVGCLDSPIGYLPTEIQCREGGYESNGQAEFFGCGTPKASVESFLYRVIGETIGNVTSGS